MQDKNIKDEKTLLIIEKSQFNLVKKSSDSKTGTDNKKDYVFEGVFAVLGEKNKNHRIYTEDQYLPQIERLQQEIAEKKVWGEANHPTDRFDINILNVSHVIERIEYDKKNRLITGQVRLLDTTAGKEVKALVNEGLPIHISSRAAGSVNEDGTVVMKHLFTYDIVHNPGFAQARLNRVNEQYGLEDAENLSLFEVSGTKVEEAILNDTNKKNDSPITAKIEKKSINNNIYNKKEPNMSTDNYITEEKFSQYSNYLKDKFTSVNEKISDKSEKTIKKAETLVNKTGEKCNTLEEKYDNLLEYVEYLGNHLNKSIAHNDHIVEYVSDMQKYMSYLSENLDNNIGYVKYLAETADKNIEYSKYLSEKLNSSLNHSDHIVEGVNDIQDEILNSRSYSEYIAEQVDKSLQYSEYLAEQLDTGIQYSEHVGTKLNETINYTNYLRDNTNKNIAYSEYLAENIDGAGIPVAGNITVTDDNYEHALSEKLDVLVESAKKQKALSNDSSHHFLKFMHADDVKIFTNLNESMKKQVIAKFETEEYYSTADVNRIFENVINDSTKELPLIVEKMKDHHRKVWTALNENQKAKILNESKNYEITSQEDIDKFWDSRKIDETSVETIQFNNSLNEDVKSDTPNDEYMKYIEAELMTRMGK